MRTNLIVAEYSAPSKVSTNKSKKDNKEGKLDMVIAFDTTGSMHQYIKDVKNHVMQLIPQLFSDNPNIRISIVAFGDYCDMYSSTVFGKAYQVIDLTDNQEDLINFVKNAKGTAGGDGDEFYELVIRKIVNETSWRKDSEKAVLLIADAYPHPVGYSYSTIVQNSNINWREEAQEAAKKGIKFDTTVCGTATWYAELSKLTNGVCVPFKSSGNSSELVRASALARGGAATMDSFTAAMADCTDSEMRAVYAAYSKEIM